MFNTPILFIIYKNPEITKVAFNRIREIKPKRLFISADGPKTAESNELDEIEFTRNVTNFIDWDCQVTRRYLDYNLGCKLGVSTAISWFFTHVENGIILEYDCLPSISFFRFCEELLEKYKDNSLVLSISGNSLDNVDANDDFKNNKCYETYYFSNFVKVWGWATWRRAWAKFDISMNDFPDFSSKKQISKVLKNKKIEIFWMDKYSKVYYGQNKTTWAFIWSFCHILNNSFSITPNINLVSNIGFGDGGTHAKSSNNLLANLESSELTFPIIHSDIIVGDSVRDLHFTNVLYEAEKKELRIIYLKSLIPTKVVAIFKLARRFLVKYKLIEYKKGWQ